MTQREKIKELIRLNKEIKGKRMDFDSLLDTLDDTQEMVEPELTETPETPERGDILDEMEDVDFKPEETTTQNTDIEYAQETDAYVRAKLQLEMDIKAIKQEQKDLQDEFKDQGVDIKNVNKAINELKKELKETPDEAKDIQALKSRFQADDGIYTTITMSTE